MNRIEELRRTGKYIPSYYEYNIVSAIRGPDDTTRTVEKSDFTSLIRQWYFNGDEIPGDVSYLTQDQLKRALIEMSRIKAHNHFLCHVKQAAFAICRIEGWI